MKIKLFCTLGPKSLNKKFLNFSNNNVDLLRINLSHIKINQLENLIKFIKKYSKTPICIDTEGAQIRTKVKKKKFYKLNSRIKIFKDKGNFRLYPSEVYEKIKIKDLINIGFSGLKIKIKKKNHKFISATVIQAGLLEKNKGTHVTNRKLKLDYLTHKDFLAINLGKKLKIKNYALSFTNNYKDIIKFNRLLKTENKIFKLETRSALKDLKNILKFGKNFLIDRGDLSQDISVEQVPLAQRRITTMGNRKGKNIFVATNFLESMLLNNEPTRGEVNDIYSTLELGAKGLVLAAETAIGKHPIFCVEKIKKIIKIYKKNTNKKYG